LRFQSNRKCPPGTDLIATTIAAKRSADAFQDTGVVPSESQFQLRFISGPSRTTE
jgi:hypothetical protein